MIDLIGIQMDRDMNVRLQKLARHHNCTVDDLIVEAVSEYYADEFRTAEQTEPSSDWICDTCKYHTIERAVQCKMCGDGGQYEPKQTEPKCEECQHYGHKVKRCLLNKCKYTADTDCGWK